MPSSAAYRKRFGSLGRAYRLIGAAGLRDDAYVEINRALRLMHPTVTEQTVAEIERSGATVARGNRDGHLVISNEIVLNLIIARCIETSAGNLRWVIRLEPNASADLTVAVRMDRGNTEIRDYYLLPRIELAGGSVRLTEDNGVFLDAFRFDSLDYLFEMTARAPVRRAA